MINPTRAGPEQPNQQVLSMLQSVSMTLSDVQGQLATIQQQNERDSTLNRLEGEIQAMKRKNEAPQNTPNSKRHRKSPCGVSASDNVIYYYLILYSTILALCMDTTFIV